MSKRHTPGPWTADITDNPADGSPAWGVDAAEHSVCILDGPQDVNEPNARLIASAPDLLELCRAVLLRLDLEAAERAAGAIFPCAAMREDLRAAIKRAEGE